ncbi:hypothetical protein LTR10_019851 [Elasticomyces elasticus]|uniref:Transcription factor domain-containing protein n=1 Tax=Exophiala sideris TaxID=1016849 RepID=A0ABR0J1A6_9EURO|nr:hypothetical protein LTR10_019851 [Elasticomyces elasticus]KAK5024435.1 hypothetical protein LTS07_008726 [Exophiala sideris]KAK5030883.1 hypothetical protein LTR13_007896 [Exophiala sideris]KAK5054168.1 hypothetical protein LTR69_009130 [Exophiala sideris]KAK5179476.1 hypothetical protein LTR44_007992 [Eurotiomycetes sp. CCFEE 6388]
MSTLFAPPIGSQPSSAVAWQLQSSRKKRKRRKVLDSENDEKGGNGPEELQKPLNTMTDVEYTAVVTPSERLQRRVAGQPINQHPPPLPFPHSQTRKSPDQEAFVKKRVVKDANAQRHDLPRSLRFQHLSALTAIVHRCLLQEDFPRASRALGLMFREESLKRSAAARNQGYMGIGAEVLLRQGNSKRSPSDTTPTPVSFTSEGFENARRFYERLIVKHPFHKSWPGSVNAVDFYLALFNMWVYVVHAEYSKQNLKASESEGILHETASSPRVVERVTSVDTGAKVRELEQAREIASRMDTCMASLPYRDEPELIRLRAMVALWMADLYEDSRLHFSLHNDEVSDVAHEPLKDHPSSSLDMEGPSWWADVDPTNEAVKARDLAGELLAGLKGNPNNDENDE